LKHVHLKYFWEGMTQTTPRMVCFERGNPTWPKPNTSTYSD